MFLPVNIDSGGYIKWRKLIGTWAVVHRETRELHYERNAFKTLDEAKAKLSEWGCNAILELTREGGGHAIFVKPSNEAEVKARLRTFRTCYGAWETRLLKEE